MKPKINKQDIEFLINCFKNGKEIPEVYKYAIFPTKQKEYELVYAGKMRKEDVLADTEEAKPVPLQIEKVFNGKKYPLYSKDWHNLLVFGDNLQILKTFNENKDPLVKNKIKGKVKLIYIDPPFGTGDEYDGAKGQSAYSAKKKGADFVEFLRRRLVLLKELMANDGAIFVRMDYHFGHYLKVIMDEVFDKGSFKNEIIIKRGYVPKGKTSQFPTATDSLFFYSRSDNFNLISNTKSIEEKDRKWISLDMPGQRKDKTIRQRTFLGKKIYPPKGQHWGLSQEKIDELEKRGDIRINPGRTYIDTEGKKVKGMPEFFKEPFVLLNSNWTDIKSYETHNTFYPTENSEELLERIISSCTEKGDLVMDVFVGSGTTAAVAEKLERRWIACDIGKLAIYTVQKRLLEIDESKDLENPKKKYGKPSKSFAVVTSGLYDLGKIFALQKDEYINFVKNLFEIEETKTTKIGGVEIDGKKREFYAKIFPYWELKNASVDEKYLQELHKNIGKKIDGRFYIIAPANNVDFISDYHEIGDVRYYFLKVPYQIIKELHKVQFKKFRQPQSKSQINDLDEAIGFHFIRQPEVKSEIKKLKDKVVLKIKKFESAYSQDETGEKLKNFESLAMLLVDLNYDGEKFMMTNYFFADDLLNTKKEETEEEIKAELKKKKEIIREFLKKDCGKEIMAIYVDIYGNEFKEVFKIK
ncbi:site-specific DNA-methyltransferase [Patescibacteria group bacterium]|nr:site-specific DNA-methyltransferase [Patescibacteria group bacterium]MBU4369076.1 site-specific DNA-methyltransferase [Patescibacteria group bacterium]